MRYMICVQCVSSSHLEWLDAMTTTREGVCASPTCFGLWNRSKCSEVNYMKKTALLYVRLLNIESKNNRSLA